MLDKFISKVFSSKHERDIKKATPLVEEINHFAEEYRGLTDAQLQAKTEEFRSRLKEGQTLDDLLPEAYAAVKEGRFGLASQTIMGDRRGAPVTAYTRIGDRKIVARSPITTPDYLIVLDPTLILAVDLESDLKAEGEIIINATKDLGFAHRAIYVDATSISLKHLGRPVVNTAMLGAFAAATGVVGLEAVVAAAREPASRA